MSIKRHTKGTGYTKKHFDHFNLNDFTEDEFKKEVWPRLVGLTFDARIDAWEQVCRHTLTAAGYMADVNAKDFHQELSNLEFQTNEWFAWQILNKISFVRAIRERGDKQEEAGLLNFTLDLGHLIAEWNVKSKMRLTSSSSTNPQEVNKHQDEYREAFRRATEERKLPTMRAYHAAAKECDVSWKTIQRAMKDNSS